MRKFKFRAWDRVAKEMFFCTKQFSIAVSMCGSVIGYEENEEKSQEIVVYDGRFIIEQFTGLTDVNGVEIYEGDIVEHNGLLKEILFYEGSFIARTIGYGALSDMSLIRFATNRTFKVIGNIHENPELVGKV